MKNVSKTVDEQRIEAVFVKNMKGGDAIRYNPVILLNNKYYVSLEKYFLTKQKLKVMQINTLLCGRRQLNKNERKLDEKLKVFLKDVEDITL